MLVICKMKRIDAVVVLSSLDWRFTIKRFIVEEKPHFDLRLSLKILFLPECSRLVTSNGTIKFNWR